MQDLTKTVNWLTPELLAEYQERAKAMIVQDHLSPATEREVELIQPGVVRAMRRERRYRRRPIEELQARARRFAIRDVLLTQMQREYFDRNR